MVIIVPIAVLSLVVRLAMGIFFLIAGGGKLVNLREFKKIIVAYGILKGNLCSALAYSLPILEVMVAIVLLMNLLRPSSEYLAGLLLLTYTAGVVINLFRGRRELPCGCFGRDKETISWHMVWRNLALFGLCLIGAEEAIVIALVLIVPFFLSSVIARMSANSKGGTLHSRLESPGAGRLK